MVRSIGTIRVLGVVCALALSAFRAQAQIPDHLQCFKIKDAAAKTSYLAVITPTDVTYPPAVGCAIKVPAKLLCVDAVKSNVTPVPPGAADGIAGQKYLCYKTKCPKSQPVALLTDQFGSHAIEVKSTGLVCAPIPVAFSCTDMITNGDETDLDCGGSCPSCALGQDCLVATDCASGVCAGNVCAAPPASCTDGIENGAETDIDCGGGTCGPCGNGSGCLLASDCTSSICSGNVCVAPLANGQPCSSSGECASTQCVDDVCCNSTCASLCQACTAAKKGGGLDGTCGGIMGGTDPDAECNDAGPASCGTTGSCSGMLTCAIYAPGTQCLPGSCTSGVATNPDQCDGMGQCQDAGQTMCGFYACGPTTCNTMCAADMDCAANAYCSASACVAKLSQGTICSFNSQCQSGQCVDGVCCDSPCNSTCEACTAAKKGSGADGGCGSIANGTDPDNECAGAMNCDGAGMCTP